MAAGFWADTAQRLWKNPRAMGGIVVVILVAIMAIFAGLLSPYDPIEHNMDRILEPPGLDHWLGTDRFGRDILSRIIYGARISIQVGVISQTGSLLIGILLGALAGYYRGRIDDLIMLLINVVWSFPALLFVIAVAIALGPGIQTVYLAVALYAWTGVARIVRGQFFFLRELDYVQAAQALGAGTFRIIFRHLLPNAMAPIIVVITLGFAMAIVSEAGLSFLGLGVQPPTPSWGSMLSEGYSFIVAAKWMALAPGAAITLTVLAFNLAGDGLRDAMDPRLR